MPPNDPTSRLSDLLIDPREDLSTEIKDWLNLSEAYHKASLAKAIIALANNGGGDLIIGLRETEQGYAEAPDRPANLATYGQDAINGIVERYVDPAIHCDVRNITAPSGRMHPIVSVPGGHRVPVRSKKGGPEGHSLAVRTIYIRKNGPKSEPPITTEEWDQLLGRCMTNRRDELLDQLRGILYGGASPERAQADETSTLRYWTDSGIERWNVLTSDLPQGAGARLKHGWYRIAYQVNGDIEECTLPELKDRLEASAVRYSGWPPFWVPTREGIAPYTIDNVIECWIGGDTDPTREDRDPAHSDFWRVSPDGLALLLRGYQEDSEDATWGRRMAPEPGAIFDLTLPIWRIGEALLQAESLAKAISPNGATLRFEVQYTGLDGRVLTVQPDRVPLLENNIARQDSIELSTEVDVSSISERLPEIVHPLLQPLYSLFNFFQLDIGLVAGELERLRRR